VYIDSHAHLDDKKFSRDLDRALDRASDAGVERVISVGDSLESSRKSVALAHRFDKLYATVGIHPHHVRRAQDKDYEEIQRLASDPRVVAIGEVGLDFHYNLTEPEAQKKGFERQVNMARECDLPVVVHCREAFDDLFKILKKTKAEEIGGVVHCFAGDPDQARRIVDMGWHIGVGGPITFPHADTLRKCVEVTPVERILLETDSPYLPPQAKRGRRNEPSYLKFIIKTLGDIKGIIFQDMARTTKMNTVRLFNLPTHIPAEVAYSLRRSLYLNITNECSNNCYFCHRNRDYRFAGYNLFLESQPTAEQLLERVADLEKYEEVVFCGVGEPTMRLDVLLEVAKALKNRGVRVRLNTNGLGSLVHGRDIVADLASCFDAVSISLNAATPEDYEQLCRPAQKGAFQSIIEFTKKCKKAIPEVVLTVVGAPGVDIEACRVLAEEKLKVPLRVREYCPVPKSEIRHMPQ